MYPESNINTEENLPVYCRLQHSSRNAKIFSIQRFSSELDSGYIHVGKDNKNLLAIFNNGFSKAR